MLHERLGGRAHRVREGAPAIWETLLVTETGIGEIALPQCRDRAWTRAAIDLLQGDRHRSADTHLLKPIFKGQKSTQESDGWQAGVAPDR
jgi:hypothetical protein